jgi:uncharacterized DUF497 family protein
MVRFELTQHARDALMKRNISMELLERVLALPQRIERDATDAMLEHRLAAISEHGDRVLRVIINRHTTPIRVVTLYFDRKMRGRL